MRTEYVVESRDATIVLSIQEAADLAAIGARLASKKTWWGAADEGEAGDTERSVLRVHPLGDGRWTVRVSDAVGVVSTGDLQLIVQPKIPTAHLLFLFAKSGEFPRNETQSAALAASTSMWELVAGWFVDATERLFRIGLVRDYVERLATLDTVSGRIEVMPTVAHFYAGRLEVDCTFDEYGYDMPLNRVVLAALDEVARSSLLLPALRRRALVLRSRLEDVGPVQPQDLVVALDRRTSHYRTSFQLGRHVLGRLGRHLAEGSDASWTFLIRTPEMIEAGIRQVLRERLGPLRITKERRQISGTTLTFNPDLVFDHGAAVGDVKYKISSGEWHRADLYQTIAFAEAFEARRGLVIRFRGPGIPSAPDLVVGTKEIHEITWAVGEALPAVAAELVADEVHSWLEPAALAWSA